MSIKKLGDLPAVTSFDLRTQTPGEYNPSNHYLEVLQKKINYDWNFRPNRATVGREDGKGTLDFKPIEVVLQTVKSDKGEIISDNWRRIVFKDVREECIIGERFKFGYEFTQDEKEEDKSIWIVANLSRTSMTSSVVAVRCNTTIGSVYKDERGVEQTHFEPIVLAHDSTSISLFYNSTIMVPQADLTFVCQHNKWTRNYYINQRFVIGYDQVYRIQGINKFDSIYTFRPEEAGIMTVSLERVEISEKDNFATRIAYNGDNNTVNIDESSQDDYQLKIVSPEVLPTFVKSTPITFVCKLFKNDEEQDINISVQGELANCNTPDSYFEIQKISNTEFTLKRLRFYGGGALTIKCFIPKEESPTQEEIYISFNINLNAL